MPVQAPSASHASGALASGRAERRIEQRLARRGGVVEGLTPLAWIFGALTRLRSALYRRGWLRVMQVDVSVVSVGNLTVGGTGKTPLVEWLVRTLQERGISVGLLSRGYGRVKGAELNDEGLLLAETCHGVPHVQDRDRVAGAARLVDQGVDVILLDDGFQHRRLHRDLDIVLIDATRPWGLAPACAGQEPLCALLPRGLMREPRSALARADLLLLTRADAVDAKSLQGLTRTLAQYAPGVPIAEARHAPRAFRRLAAEARDDERRGLDEFQGLEVDLVSGIGNPPAFEASVRSTGALVGEHRAFPDHHDFEQRDLERLGSRPVIVTAKDSVKLRGRGMDLWVLDVELELLNGRDELERLLDGLPESPRRNALDALHAGLHG
ncbi:MAG: tetraacyldisaccharide 4'-kinase [Chlamydiales bacterium]|jgi:tetraacyldisaccharide 4'-kinase